jgi:sirohydrochlorin cobaltochelatase
MNGNTGILLFAHGSRDPAWRAPFEAILTEVRRQYPGAAELAFLENMAPSFDTAIDRLIAGGVNAIRVVPVFLAAGSHLRQDIPDLVARSKKRLPEIQFTLFPAVGENLLIQRSIASVALGPDVTEIPLLNWYAEDLGLAGQLSVEHVRIARDKGFKSLICNRPDDEATVHQTPHAEIRQACHDLGLEFYYHPVAPSGHTDAQALTMTEFLGQATRPTLVYCRSGTRSKKLIDQGMQLHAEKNL